MFSPVGIGKGPDASVYILGVSGFVSLAGVAAYLVGRKKVWRLAPEQSLFHTFAGYIFAAPIAWFFIVTLVVIVGMYRV